MPRSLRLRLYSALEVLLAAYRRLNLRLGERVPLLRTLYTRLTMLVRPQQVTIRGQTVYLHPEDKGLTHLILFEGGFEDFEMDLFLQALEPGATVLDIGANVGLYTLLAAARVGPTGRVYAFEPARDNFDLLKKNVAANKHTNVVPMQYAVGERDGEIQVYLAKENRGDHRTYATQDDYTREHYSVRLAALDSVLAPSVAPSVIKMDIQGFEMYAVRGMRQVLARSERLALYTEFWPHGLRGAGIASPAEYIEELKALGFEVFRIDGATRSLSPVDDAAGLVASLPGEEFTDLMCLKGEWPTLRATLHQTAGGFKA